MRFPMFAASLFLLGAPVALAAESFEEAQQRLDAECEAAREAKLAPERARYIEECVEKKQRPDRESCERFYADYGNQSGNRAPLYLDLPECVKAFEHQRSQHAPD
ncbi:MAG: hypothetical protein V2I57_00195 [Xanthomonadales bacterium]|nr:hypothetical protein [Xanthomonadales bacterium]